MENFIRIDIEGKGDRFSPVILSCFFSAIKKILMTKMNTIKHTKSTGSILKKGMIK